MLPARAILACAVLLLAPGCVRDLGHAPSISGVEPATGPAFAATSIRVKGEGFSRRIYSNFGNPSGSEPKGGFTLRLVLGEAVTPLADVTLVSGTELSATVPAGLPVGSYRLELTDPWERTASLDSAFAVLSCSAACDDGLTCTTDSCEGDTCHHVLLPDQCLIAGACYAPGQTKSDNTCLSCEPATTPTDWTTRADSTPCDDGNACTSGERCVSGACGSPTRTVTCVPSDDCHQAGTCDPGTGQCGPGPAVADNTPCNDSNACTSGESCHSGACGSPIATVICPTRGPCFGASTCDPGTGKCSAPPPLADGGTCDDGYACTSNDACDQGVCRGVANGTCANTPPLACLTVNPAGVLRGDTVDFDASCSWDIEDPASSLQVRFDFQGTGTWTTLSTTKTASFTYGTAGTYTAAVEVRDSQGLIAYATRLVVVAGNSDNVLVTTSIDEADPGASPSSPGGTGLSLREAILYVNSSTTARTIRFATPMTIAFTSPLPALSASGATLVGRPGVVLDFEQASMADAGLRGCLTLATSSQRVIAIDAIHCDGPTVQTRGSSAQIADSRFHEGMGSAAGVDLAGNAGTLGPRTEVYGFSGPGVLLSSSGNTLDTLSVHENGSGLAYASASISNVVVQRSAIYANQGPGISLTPSPTTFTAQFNTIDGNKGDGLTGTNSTSGLTARNNLLTRNGGGGLCGMASAYTNREPNGYFANDGGSFCQGAPDAGSVTADPLYLAPSRGDFRLTPGSPMINAGVDLGLDVNGPATGNFNGARPDFGANEAP